LIELAKKEQESLDVWRKNVQPFSAWLDETNGKLDEIQNSVGDTENLEQRHLALQVLANTHSLKDLTKRHM
jgi:hypothetical protein